MVRKGDNYSMVALKEINISKCNNLFLLTEIVVEKNMPTNRGNPL